MLEQMTRPFSPPVFSLAARVGALRVFVFLAYFGAVFVALGPGFIALGPGFIALRPGFLALGLLCLIGTLGLPCFGAPWGTFSDPRADWDRALGEKTRPGAGVHLGNAPAMIFIRLAGQKDLAKDIKT